MCKIVGHPLKILKGPLPMFPNNKNIANILVAMYPFAVAPVSNLPGRY